MTVGPQKTYYGHLQTTILYGYLLLSFDFLITNWLFFLSFNFSVDNSLQEKLDPHNRNKS